MQKTGIIILAGQAGSGKDTVGNYIAQKHGAVTIGQADPMKRFAADVFGFTEHQLWGPSEMRNAKDQRFENLADDECEELNDELDDRFFEHADQWIAEVLPGLDLREHNLAFAALESWFSGVMIKLLDEGLTPRYVLQTLGTEWGRRFSSDMWIDYAIRKAEAVLGGPNTYDRMKGLQFSNKPARLAVITDGRFRNEMGKVRARNGIAVRIVRPGAAPTADIGGVKNHQSERELNEISNEDFDALIDNSGTLDDLYLTTDMVLSRFYTR